MNLKTILLGLLTLLGLASCQPKEEMEKIEWDLSVSAPKLYPVEVYNGAFLSGSNIALLPKGGYIEAGWGTDENSKGSAKFIPEILDITWLSYAENKFYTGKFKLPYDTLTALFREGIINSYNKKKDPYDIICVGMAPGGLVVVWMISSGNRQVEVARYHASPTEVEWEYFKPHVKMGREQYVRESFADNPEAVKNLEENGIQYELFERYSARHSWKPVLELPDNGKREGIEMRFFNGEYEYLWGDFLKENAFTKRTLPKTMGLLWEDKQGNLFGADVNFDEKEIFKAFEEFYKDGKVQQAELVFELAPNQEDFRIYLRNKELELAYELRKVDAGVYTRSPK